MSKTKQEMDEAVAVAREVWPGLTWEIEEYQTSAATYYAAVGRCPMMWVGVEYNAKPRMYPEIHWVAVFCIEFADKIVSISRHIEFDGGGNLAAFRAGLEKLRADVDALGRGLCGACRTTAEVKP